MKRIIVIAALIAAMSGAVYAQELKFDGYLNSGMGFVSDNNKDHDSYLKIFGVDSESNGYRFRLNGSYTNETKNAGARFRLQGQRRIDQSGYLSMPYLYGWLGFVDNMVTITGGLVDDGTWTSADWWWNDDTGEGLGVLVKAEPVKGLIFGVGAYIISQQGSGGNNWLQFTPITAETTEDGDTIYTSGANRLPNFGEIMLKTEDVKYTFNAAYTMPDTFRLSAIFRSKNKAGWTGTRYIEGDDYTYEGREESMFLQAEFRVLAVNNLTAVVVGCFDKLENFDKSGNMVFSETFGYKFDNLNVGLNAVQFLYNRVDANDDKVDYNPGLLFNPWVSYTIDKIVPRLDLVYFMGGRSKMSNGNNQWERRGFVNAAKAKDAEDDYSVLSARPSVKFNVDNKTFLEIGDMINYDMAVKDGAYKDSGDLKKKSLFTNVFYVDVKFSF
ncbi:MAG: hypothetical protein LBB89_01305 [Treponema sp.]|jgi:hypothetical protein|nr:hypothetical protein [Treponema sp.]